MTRSYTLRGIDSNGHVIGATRTITIPDPPSATPPPEPAGSSGDGYPEDGSIGDVLAWVDQATAEAATGRAKAAIVAEHGRTKPRTTLLTQLNERTGGRDALE